MFLLGKIMSKIVGHDGFVLNFVPDLWDSVVKFGKFNYAPLAESYMFKRGIGTTADHLNKFRTLADVATNLIPGFDIDAEELDRNGHSTAKYSAQFAAVAECCINELYSSLDGIRDVIYVVYSSAQGVQKNSTGKLFLKALNNGYGTGFPVELKNILSEACNNWFLQLRRYRTEFAHGSLGSCHKDRETGRICYMHSGLGGASGCLIIEDFIKYINDSFNNVHSLQHKVFEFFYRSLPLESAVVPCGFYQGRIYMREIHPEENLSRNSGICRAVDYEMQCPMKETCEAYEKATKKV